MRTYAGIGSRATPPQVLARIEQIAERLAQLGWTLRSGGAPGADTAFEAGCDRANGQKEIFLPWQRFNGHDDGIVLGDNPEALLLAAEYHPAWKSLKVGARRLHARNTGQILGPRLTADERSAFVLCWTPGGRGEGGTAQALRVAQAYRVPIVDLAWPDALPKVTELVRR